MSGVSCFPVCTEIETSLFILLAYPKPDDFSDNEKGDNRDDTAPDDSDNDALDLNPGLSPDFKTLHSAICDK